MTEAEWLASTLPPKMLSAIPGSVSRRKGRLFAVACCRRIRHLLKHKRSIALVEVAERVADGKASEEERAKAYRQANMDNLRRRKSAAYYATEAALFANTGDVDITLLATHAVGFAAAAVSSKPGEVVPRGERLGGLVVALEGAAPSTPGEVASRVISWELPNSSLKDFPDAEAELTEQASLLRDIFGNPFRPVTVDPRWLTSTAIAIAQGIYADRAFDRLPILADALEEAGCDKAGVLGHCRGDGPHVRGCWVVDMVLGKE